MMKLMFAIGTSCPFSCMLTRHLELSLCVCEATPTEFRAQLPGGFREKTQEHKRGLREEESIRESREDFAQETFLPA